jgi:hypothetical protein
MTLSVQSQILLLLKSCLRKTMNMASQLFYVRLLLAVGVMTFVINVAFLVPLEESASAIKRGGSQNPFLPIKKDAPIIAKPAPQTPQINAHEPPIPAKPRLTEEEGRQHILSIFEEAGVSLEDSQKAQLPSWNQVQDVVGEHPYIVGLEKCKEFRDTVPAVERMLGSAGMFNTGYVYKPRLHALAKI